MATDHTITIDDSGTCIPTPQYPNPTPKGDRVRWDNQSGTDLRLVGVNTFLKDVNGTIDVDNGTQTSYYELLDKPGNNSYHANDRGLMKGTRSGTIKVT